MMEQYGQMRGLAAPRPQNPGSVGPSGAGDQSPFGPMSPMVSNQRHGGSMMRDMDRYMPMDGMQGGWMSELTRDMPRVSRELDGMMMRQGMSDNMSRMGNQMMGMGGMGHPMDNQQYMGTGRPGGMDSPMSHMRDASLGRPGHLDSPHGMRDSSLGRPGQIDSPVNMMSPPRPDGMGDQHRGPDMMRPNYPIPRYFGMADAASMSHMGYHDNPMNQGPPGMHQGQGHMGQMPGYPQMRFPHMGSEPRLSGIPRHMNPEFGMAQHMSRQFGSPPPPSHMAGGPTMNTMGQLLQTNTMSPHQGSSEASQPSSPSVVNSPMHSQSPQSQSSQGGFTPQSQNSQGSFPAPGQTTQGGFPGQSQGGQGYPTPGSQPGFPGQNPQGSQGGFPTQGQPGSQGGFPPQNQSSTQGGFPAQNQPSSQGGFPPQSQQSSQGVFSAQSPGPQSGFPPHSQSSQPGYPGQSQGSQGGFPGQGQMNYPGPNQGGQANFSQQNPTSANFPLQGQSSTSNNFSQPGQNMAGLPQHSPSSQAGFQPQNQTTPATFSKPQTSQGSFMMSNIMGTESGQFSPKTTPMSPQSQALQNTGKPAGPSPLAPSPAAAGPSPTGQSQGQQSQVQSPMSEDMSNTGISKQMQGALQAGHSPMHPGQSPLHPGQSPMHPGQSPMHPSQSPLHPGPSPSSNTPSAVGQGVGAGPACGPDGQPPSGMNPPPTSAQSQVSQSPLHESSGSVPPVPSPASMTQAQSQPQPQGQFPGQSPMQGSASPAGGSHPGQFPPGPGPMIDSQALGTPGMGQPHGAPGQFPMREGTSPGMMSPHGPHGQFPMNPMRSPDRSMGSPMPPGSYMHSPSHQSPSPMSMNVHYGRVESPMPRQVATDAPYPPPKVKKPRGRPRGSGTGPRGGRNASGGRGSRGRSPSTGSPKVGMPSQLVGQPERVPMEETMADMLSGPMGPYQAPYGRVGPMDTQLAPYERSIHRVPNPAYSPPGVGQEQMMPESFQGPMKPDDMHMAPGPFPDPMRGGPYPGGQGNRMPGPMSAQMFEGMGPGGYPGHPGPDGMFMGPNRFPGPGGMPPNFPHGGPMGPRMNQPRPMSDLPVGPGEDLEIPGPLGPSATPSDTSTPESKPPMETGSSLRPDAGGFDSGQQAPTEASSTAPSTPSSQQTDPASNQPAKQSDPSEPTSDSKSSDKAETEKAEAKSVSEEKSDDKMTDSDKVDNQDKNSVADDSGTAKATDSDTAGSDRIAQDKDKDSIDSASISQDTDQGQDSDSRQSLPEPEQGMPGQSPARPGQTESMAVTAPNLAQGPPRPGQPPMMPGHQAQGQGPYGPNMGPRHGPPGQQGPYGHGPPGYRPPGSTHPGMRGGPYPGHMRPGSYMGPMRPGAPPIGAYGHGPYGRIVRAPGMSYPMNRGMHHGYSQSGQMGPYNSPMRGAAPPYGYNMPGAGRGGPGHGEPGSQGMPGPHGGQAPPSSAAGDPGGAGSFLSLLTSDDDDFKMFSGGGDFGMAGGPGQPGHRQFPPGQNSPATHDSQTGPPATQGPPDQGQPNLPQGPGGPVGGPQGYMNRPPLQPPYGQPNMNMPRGGPYLSDQQRMMFNPQYGQNEDMHSQYSAQAHQQYQYGMRFGNPMTGPRPPFVDPGEGGPQMDSQDPRAVLGILRGLLSPEPVVPKSYCPQQQQQQQQQMQLPLGEMDDDALAMESPIPRVKDGLKGRGTQPVVVMEKIDMEDEEGAPVAGSSTEGLPETAEPTPPSLPKSASSSPRSALIGPASFKAAMAAATAGRGRTKAQAMKQVSKQLAKLTEGTKGKGRGKKTETGIDSIVGIMEDGESTEDIPEEALLELTGDSFEDFLDEDIESEPDDDWEPEVSNKRKPWNRKAPGRRRALRAQESEEEEGEVPQPKRVRRGPPKSPEPSKKKKAKESKPAAKGKKAKAVAEPKANKRNRPLDEEDEEEEDLSPRSKKTKVVPKSKITYVSDEEIEEPPQKSKTTKGKKGAGKAKKKELPPPSRAPQRRSTRTTRAQVFVESDEEDEIGFGEFESDSTVYYDSDKDKASDDDKPLKGKAKATKKGAKGASKPDETGRTSKSQKKSQPLAAESDEDTQLESPTEVTAKKAGKVKRSDSSVSDLDAKEDEKPISASLKTEDTEADAENAPDAKDVEEKVDEETEKAKPSVKKETKSGAKSGVEKKPKEKKKDKKEPGKKATEKGKAGAKKVAPKKAGKSAKIIESDDDDDDEIIFKTTPTKEDLEAFDEQNFVEEESKKEEEGEESGSDSDDKPLRSTRGAVKKAAKKTAAKGANKPVQKEELEQEKVEKVDVQPALPDQPETAKASESSDTQSQEADSKSKSDVNKDGQTKKDEEKNLASQVEKDSDEQKKDGTKGDAKVERRSPRAKAKDATESSDEKPSESEKDGKKNKNRRKSASSNELPAGDSAEDKSENDKAKDSTSTPDSESKESADPEATPKKKRARRQSTPSAEVSADQAEKSSDSKSSKSEPDSQQKVADSTPEVKKPRRPRRSSSTGGDSQTPSKPGSEKNTSNEDSGKTGDSAAEVEKEEGNNSKASAPESKKQRGKRAQKESESGGADADSQSDSKVKPAASPAGKTSENKAATDVKKSRKKKENEAKDQKPESNTDGNVKKVAQSPKDAEKKSAGRSQSPGADTKKSNPRRGSVKESDDEKTSDSKQQEKPAQSSPKTVDKDESKKDAVAAEPKKPRSRRGSTKEGDTPEVKAAVKAEDKVKQDLITKLEAATENEKNRPAASEPKKPRSRRGSLKEGDAKVAGEPGEKVKSEPVSAGSDAKSGKDVKTNDESCTEIMSNEDGNDKDDEEKLPDSPVKTRKMRSRRGSSKEELEKVNKIESAGQKKQATEITEQKVSPKQKVKASENAKLTNTKDSVQALGPKDLIASQEVTSLPMIDGKTNAFKPEDLKSMEKSKAHLDKDKEKRVHDKKIASSPKEAADMCKSLPKSRRESPRAVEVPDAKQDLSVKSKEKNTELSKSGKESVDKEQKDSDESSETVSDVKKLRPRRGSFKEGNEPLASEEKAKSLVSDNVTEPSPEVTDKGKENLSQEKFNQGKVEENSLGDESGHAVDNDNDEGQKPRRSTRSAKENDEIDSNKVEDILPEKNVVDDKMDSKMTNGKLDNNDDNTSTTSDSSEKDKYLVVVCTPLKTKNESKNDGGAAPQSNDATSDDPKSSMSGAIIDGAEVGANVQSRESASSRVDRAAPETPAPSASSAQTSPQSQVSASPKPPPSSAPATTSVASSEETPQSSEKFVSDKVTPQSDMSPAAQPVPAKLSQPVKDVKDDTSTGKSVPEKKSSPGSGVAQAAVSESKMKEEKSKDAKAAPVAGNKRNVSHKEDAGLVQAENDVSVVSNSKDISKPVKNEIPKTNLSDNLSGLHDKPSDVGSDAKSSKSKSADPVKTLDAVDEKTGSSAKKEVGKSQQGSDGEKAASKNKVTSLASVGHVSDVQTPPPASSSPKGSSDKPPTVTPGTSNLSPKSKKNESQSSATIAQSSADNDKETTAKGKVDKVHGDDKKVARSVTEGSADSAKSGIMQKTTSDKDLKGVAKSVLVAEAKISPKTKAKNTPDIRGGEKDTSKMLPLKVDTTDGDSHLSDVSKDSVKRDCSVSGSKLGVKAVKDITADLAQQSAIDKKHGPTSKASGGREGNDIIAELTKLASPKSESASISKSSVGPVVASQEVTPVQQKGAGLPNLHINVHTSPVAMTKPISPRTTSPGADRKTPPFKKKGRSLESIVANIKGGKLNALNEPSSERGLGGKSSGLDSIVANIKESKSGHPERGMERLSSKAGSALSGLESIVANIKDGKHSEERDRGHSKVSPSSHHHPFSRDSQRTSGSIPGLFRPHELGSSSCPAVPSANVTCDGVLDLSKPGRVSEVQPHATTHRQSASPMAHLKPFADKKPNTNCLSAEPRLTNHGQHYKNSPSISPQMAPKVYHSGAWHIGPEGQGHPAKPRPKPVDPKHHATPVGAGKDSKVHQPSAPVEPPTPAPTKSAAPTPADTDTKLTKQMPDLPAERTPLDIVCDVCKVGIRSAVAFHAHVSSTHKQDRAGFFCTQCGLIFPSLHLVESHAQSSHGRKDSPPEAGARPDPQCAICRAGMTTDASFQTHVYRTHGFNISGFICQECKLIFPQKSMLKAHTKKAHVVTVANVTRVTPTKRLHYRSSSQPIHQCSHCHLKFKWTYNHVVHIEEAHLKTGKYPCPKCSKQCNSRAKLPQHMSRAHRRDQVAESRQCTRRPSNLKSWHHAHRTEVLRRRCEVCGILLRGAHGYWRHKQSHRERKPHQCNICSKSFVRKTIFDLHILAHSGRSIYTCSECPTSFVQLYSLKRHLKLRHPHLDITHTDMKKFRTKVKKAKASSL